MWAFLPRTSQRGWQNYSSYEILNLQHGSFGTPRAFPHQLIGCDRVQMGSKQKEDRHPGCLSGGVEAWFVERGVTIKGWVPARIMRRALYLNPWCAWVKKSTAESRGVPELLVHCIEAMGETGPELDDPFELNFEVHFSHSIWTYLCLILATVSCFTMTHHDTGRHTIDLITGLDGKSCSWPCKCSF